MPRLGKQEAKRVRNAARRGRGGGGQKGATPKRHRMGAGKTPLQKPTLEEPEPSTRNYA